MKKAPGLKAFAQENRRNMTKEESQLWYRFLRKYPVPFHRQYVVDQYILDFFCYQAMLAVELDGSQHYESDAMLRDSLRTSTLEAYGIKVLRFSNLDVLHHFSAVCEVIDREIQVRIAHKR